MILAFALMTGTCIAGSVGPYAAKLVDNDKQIEFTYDQDAALKAARAVGCRRLAQPVHVTDANYWEHSPMTSNGNVYKVTVPNIKGLTANDHVLATTLVCKTKSGNYAWGMERYVAAMAKAGTPLVRGEHFVLNNQGYPNALIPLN